MPAPTKEQQHHGKGPEKPSGARRFLKWGATALGGAILVGIGGTVWTNVYEDAQQVTTDPVAVDVRVDPVAWEKDPLWTPYFYWIPRGPEQFTAPPDKCQQRRQWAWDLQGADADETRLLLTLFGARSGEVSFDSMRVVVDSRRPLPAGAVAACPVGGATAEVHGVSVDLDTESVEFVRPGGEPTPARFTLEKGKTETFDIYASTSSDAHLIEWHLELEVVDSAGRRTVIVQDGDAPFRTAGAAAAGADMVVWEDGAWVPWKG